MFENNVFSNPKGWLKNFVGTKPRFIASIISLVFTGLTSMVLTMNALINIDRFDFTVIILEWLILMLILALFAGLIGMRKIYLYMENNTA